MFHFLLVVAVTAMLPLCTLGSPHQLQRRYTVLDHDAVVGFPQAVPAGTLGSLYLKYKPYLYVKNGCVPFPAVDAEGNVSYVLSLHEWFPPAHNAQRRSSA